MMDNVKLLEISSKQKRIADTILSEYQLTSLLSKFGKCSITGSYSYDLMYGPDIDIIVEADDPRTASLSAIIELLKLRQYQKFQYGDFEKYPRENRPQAFIVVLILIYQGIKWEIEIWFVSQYPDNIKEIDRLIKGNLTIDNKKIILSIKHQRETLKDDKHNVSSTDIYKAVLTNGVKDYNTLVLK